MEINKLNSFSGNDMDVKEVLGNILEDSGHWLLLKTNSNNIAEDLKNMNSQKYKFIFKMFKKSLNMVVAEVRDGFTIPEFLELKYDLGIKEDKDRIIIDYEI